ncbi:hypothetical protein DRN63_03195 [Nanoarchaeota archaeon]|nr:MAG: hypothetical protein DRN63_03195 [Nanoarchaeota archaeon]
MRRFFGCFFIIGLLLISDLLMAISLAYPYEPMEEVSPIEVLVKFKPGVDRFSALKRLSEIIDREIRYYKFINVSLLKLRDGINLINSLKILREMPFIQYAEPNRRLQVDELFPNDPMFEYQWGLHNVGQTNGTYDADIDAPEAWSITTGSNSVIVAIIDTGVDYTHQDLLDNMWINPFETRNGIDDDGNGYVDDIYGADTCNDDGDPLDDNGHGTHVAGIIGAVGNNGEGVTGVNWHVKIMALKFADASGVGWVSDAIEAIEYVINMKKRGINVKITNNSWGSGEFSQALYDAIAALQDSGILFVASAGNSGRDNDLKPHYPSSYNLSNIISVAATNDRDELTWFSNWGQLSVDLAAPGQSILSTFLANSYQHLSGTSMATAYVSGVAALILSKNPSYTYLQVKRLILSAVDEVTELENLVSSDGRLNAYNCLTYQPNVIKILPITIRQNFTWKINEKIVLKVEVISGADPVNNANVTATFIVDGVRRKILRLHDDGLAPDDVENDGIYVAEFVIDFVGNIQVSVNASKEGFQSDAKIFNGRSLAYLSDFPMPFVMNGTANYTIILGDSGDHGCFNLGARTVDALGSILISAKLGLEAEQGLPEIHLDTDLAKCVNGSIRIDWDKINSPSLIAVGGPAVNMIVYRYNSSSPYKWIYDRSSGSKIYSELSGKVYTSDWGSSDHVVIEIMEESGRPILIVWGLSGYGTLAGTLVLAHYERYGDLLIGKGVLLKWEDSNGNHQVDEKDQISLVEVWGAPT